MSAIYDNWEKLVDAVLKKEQLWQLFHSDSISISSDSSGFSFCNLTSLLDSSPFADGNSLPQIFAVEPIKNVASKPARKRDLKIEVPKLQKIQFENVSCSSECHRKVSPRTTSPRVESRGEGIHSKPETKQQSYPLPLPPGAVLKSKSKSAPVSPTTSAAKSPSASSRSPERAENVRSPWKKGKLIGRGLLRNVYLGFDSEKGEMCAMKEARLSSDVHMKRGARMLEKEIALLSRMKHPNIVQYFGSETVGDNFYIYLEYVSGGSIHTILQEYGKLGESAIRNYTQQILAGLAYLHSKDIVHGNIKAASILVDPNGTVKLSNFVIEKHIAGRSNSSFLMDSPYWIAPEVIMNSNVRKSASDIWSLGCTILEMATSKPPLSQYKGVMAMFKVSCQNELPTIPDGLSDVCKDFLRHCLQLNPLRRATASQLLEHPFVTSSSPLGKQMLASPSSGHHVVTNAVKSEVIINPDVRSCAVDTWSLGCTVLEMATSKPPLSQYDGATAVFKVAYHKELPAIPDHLSADGKDFIRQCLQWNPLRRATAAQLLEHPFVKGPSPLDEKRPVSSTPLGRTAGANSVKSQGSNHARNSHQLESKSNLCRGDLSSRLLPSHHLTPLTPRSVLGPTSPVLSPLHHQQLTPPPLKSTPRTTSTASGAIHQESFRGFGKQSPNSNNPSYWDPNILQGKFRLS